jgi:acetolactate synthase regulatory subunit
MTSTLTTPPGDRIIEPMLVLAGCSKQHRIVVAGSKGVELMLELQRRGFARAAATANCGHPAGQYDVALVDWRRRTFKTLEVALDWLVDFLSPAGILVVWVDPQKAVANEALRASLEKRGFVIEAGTVHECGCAVSARRRETNPLRKAA